MRIPKYKAYIKQIDEVLDVLWINFEKKLIGIDMGYADKLETTRWDSVFRFDEVELIQSTGMQDKNGVEIYDGDVLYKEFHFKQVVSFSKGSFIMMSLDTVRKANEIDKQSLMNAFDKGSLSSFERIGNIYQNKELLEER